MVHIYKIERQLDNFQEKYLKLLSMFLSRCSIPPISFSDGFHLANSLSHSLLLLFKAAIDALYLMVNLIRTEVIRLIDLFWWSMQYHFCEWRNI